MLKKNNEIKVAFLWGVNKFEGRKLPTQFELTAPTHTGRGGRQTGYFSLLLFAPNLK